LDKESLADKLKEVNNQYDDLIKKIEPVNNKLSIRKSIQSFLGFLGLILFLFSFVLFGGIILTMVLGTFDQYFDLFLIVILILVFVWVAFIGVSRINVKNISKNSILHNKISEQLEETKTKIKKVKLLIDKEEQKLKEQETGEIVPETQAQSLELNQTNLRTGNYKFVSRSGEVKWGTKIEISEWTKEEDKLIFEEEQKKKGLVKFVPVSLQIKELMAEEGHEKIFYSKVSKKRKKSEDIPLEITWGTPEQVFEWTQKEKGYIKFVDNNGKIRWATKKQITEWQKEKNKKSKE
jgi:hypothetical protein